MSELKIPQMNVEIYRGVGFADDNFVNGWTLITGLEGNDGELETVIGFGAAGWVEKNLPNLNTDTYTKMAVRVASVAGVDTTWSVRVYDGSGWLTLWTGETDAGLYEVTLPASKTLTKIALVEEHVGDITNRVAFDYVFITKQAMLTPDVDLAESASITLPLLENGVSGAKFSIPNNNAEYTDLITEFDRVIIWLYRKGDAPKKQFGGKISDYHYRGQQENYWLDVECLGLGVDLQGPTALVQGAYLATNGKTIIQEAIDTECPELTDLFIDVDSEIATTHDVTYDEALPYNVINEICKKATTIGGVVGFDGYVDAAGNTHVFKRNKYTSPVTLSIQHYNRGIDAHRIKNKIPVYGAQTKKEPLDGDADTEVLTNWTSDGTLSLEGTDKKVGAYSIKATRVSIIVYAELTLAATVTTDFRKGYKKLHDWAKCSNTLGNDSNLLIFLCAPDYANSFVHAIDMKDATWAEIDLTIGRDAAIWTSVGSPDWNNIQQVRFVLSSSGGGATVTLLVDNHFFGEARFSGLAQDGPSQLKYGVRCAEPQVDDELTSDAECLLKAESLLDFLKEKIESLPVTVDGDNRFTPGDSQRAIIVNDALDAYFRILEIRHDVIGVHWDTALTLSNEPKMVDYIFASSAVPRYAGATVIIPRDFTGIQEGINAVVIT